MGNCFDGLPHENMDNCPNIEKAGGTSTRLQYAPLPFFETLTPPTNTGDYATRMTMPAANLTFKTDKGFKGIDVMVDETELKSTLVGNRSNKKAKSELELFIPGFKANVLGFIDAYKNVPMIFIVTDANGQKWILGTKINAAFMESADGTTGKKYEDNNGVAVKLSSNSKLYKFDGDVVELPDTTTP